MTACTTAARGRTRRSTSYMRRLGLTSLVARTLLSVPAAASAALLPPQSAQVKGTIISSSAYSFAIQTPGRAVGVLNALTTAAGKVEAQDYPYVWGGGHGQAGIPSVGSKGGPGFNGKRR